MTGIDYTGCNAQRADHATLGPDSDVVEIHFEGRTIPCRRGESLLAALVAAGELRLRVTDSGDYRGPFCGMGVCQECLVDIDGAPAQRACMTMVEEPMRVQRQSNRITAVSAPSDLPAADSAPATITPQIAVIGAGPGGMAAAASAAGAGADVLLVDERAHPGGQFYKQPLAASDLRLEDHDDHQFRAGRELIAELNRSGAKVLRAAKVVGVFEPLDLVIEHEHETRLVRPQLLIVATGAYQICHPFPGWTLPGVMTSGAAQTLLRSYRVLPGRRVLVAGNGPLNFQVAAELARAGADAVTLVEAAPKPALSSLVAFAGMVTSAPGLTLTGAGYVASLRRRQASILYAQQIVRVAQVGSADASRLVATVADVTGNRPDTRDLEVDAVCLGHGFAANNEILRALGCRHLPQPVGGTIETVRDEDCLTSREDVLAVGDCTRLGGAPTAIAEGRIAAGTALRLLGIALTRQQERVIARARATRARHGTFQRALWTLFESVQAPPRIDSNTIVCRCEELTLADLQQAMHDDQPVSMGSLKRVTRAGMGRCQGRYCGASIARLFPLVSGSPPQEADLWAPRPPAKPVRIADLARLSLPDDA